MPQLWPQHLLWQDLQGVTEVILKVTPYIKPKAQEPTYESQKGFPHLCPVALYQVLPCCFTPGELLNPTVKVTSSPGAPQERLVQWPQKVGATPSLPLFLHLAKMQDVSKEKKIYIYIYIYFSRSLELHRKGKECPRLIQAQSIKEILSNFYCVILEKEKNSRRSSNGSSE